jgi:hypothetical protein
VHESRNEFKRVSLANEHSSKVGAMGSERVDASDIFDFEGIAQPSFDSDLLFIAHTRAFEFLSTEDQASLRANQSKTRVWVSGWPSWRRLAQAGVWVEGCLESQGFGSFSAVRNKKLLQIPSEPIDFLSHDLSPVQPGARLLPSYRHHFREVPKKIWTATSLTWGSGLSFETVWDKLQHAPYTDVERKKFLGLKHRCGPGKTAEKIKSLGFNPEVFSDENQL